MPLLRIICKRLQQRAKPERRGSRGLERSNHMCQTNNIYLPHLATIEAIVDETPDVRTPLLVFQNGAVRDSFSFRAGQFAEYSAFGSGESTFCIASPPTRKGYIECCFRGVGRVTEALGFSSLLKAFADDP